jgi:hypothetical protein
METVKGTAMARFRAEPGTWVSASMKSLGYDRIYGPDEAYGAYRGVAKSPSGQPLSKPDRLTPGQEYLIPVPGVSARTEPARTDPKTDYARLTRPPLVQAEPPYSPPPLVQAEPPFDPLPWPLGPVDDDQKGIKNKLRPPKRAKRTAGGRGASLSTGTWNARLRDPDYDYRFAADPKDAGIFADPALSVDERENRLKRAEPAFAIWLWTVLQPTVSNFLINLKLELNNESQLRHVGIIFPGQSDVDRGNALENGSQKNAFRHTFGQALIARKAGRKLAVISGYAHEIQPTIDTTQRYLRIPSTPGNPSEPANRSAPANTLFDADTIADQLNNEIGRQIAERLGSTASNRDVAAAVLTEFKEKGLYAATFEMPGVIKVSREKLPPEQFEEMLKRLEDLKENGRSLAAERQREQERERQRRELRDMKR